MITAQFVFLIVHTKPGTVPGLVPGLNRSLRRDRAPFDVLNGISYDAEHTMSIRQPGHENTGGR